MLVDVSSLRSPVSDVIPVEIHSSSRRIRYQVDVGGHYALLCCGNRYGIRGRRTIKIILAILLKCKKYRPTHVHRIRVMPGSTRCSPPGIIHSRAEKMTQRIYCHQFRRRCLSAWVLLIISNWAIVFSLVPVRLFSDREPTAF
jgi:hypothetical protein